MEDETRKNDIEWFLINIIDLSNQSVIKNEIWMNIKKNDERIHIPIIEEDKRRMNKWKTQGMPYNGYNN
jgi:hypothetical protein